jgi:hypothetical protein
MAAMMGNNACFRSANWPTKISRFNSKPHHKEKDRHQPIIYLVMQRHPKNNVFESDHKRYFNEVMINPPPSAIDKIKLHYRSKHKQNCTCCLTADKMFKRGQYPVKNFFPASITNFFEFFSFRVGS